MKIQLNDGWKLKDLPMDWGADRLGSVLNDPEGWMECGIPCDVHMPLIRYGRIKDPLLADYSFDSEWIEKRSWWFVKAFDVDQQAFESEVVELVLESLDSSSDIFLNGEWLGHHISAFYPFVRNVKSCLRPGKNVLCARVTTGLEAVRDQDLAELNWAVCTEATNGCPERGDMRRAFTRKPTYTVGWDWGPKAITCGIVKDVYLRCYNGVAIRDVHAYTTSIEGGTAFVTVDVTADQLHVYATRDADISVSLSYEGAVAARAELHDYLLTSGENYVSVKLEVPDARLWWPAGAGEQNLYAVDVQVNTRGGGDRWPTFKMGLRTVSLDISRQDPANRKFMLVINGVEIFCKGGDWIPSDSIYARVPEEKYRTLLTEAVGANFNMLRVWGGGTYEYDIFFRLCDELGIMLWFDFMFCCTTAPDHQEWFRREAELEVDYQTRRLSSHPCMVLWCGNNENHTIFNPEENPRWGIQPRYDKQFGLYVANVLCKRAVRRNCPEIPYWNSSPYGGELPNDENVGDVHHWHSCMMHEDVNRRIDPTAYDQVKARFVTEYGYPGPCAKSSIETYFDGHPVDRASNIWELHNNTFEKTTVNAGIQKHYLDHPEKLDLDGYLLYAGLTQSLMLGYSLEAIRFKNDCGGSLFWMYNDTWGEVGWTIIDYYLKRKISYYGVKRAFAPVKLSLREENGTIRLQGCNDTPETVRLEGVRVGYVSFDGRTDLTELRRFTLPPFTRLYLLECPLPDQDMTRGSFMVIPEPGPVEAVSLRTNDLRQLRLEPGEPEVVSVREVSGDLEVELVSPVFLHAVHVAGEWKCTDNYFDLLPNVKKTVRVQGAAGRDLTWKAIHV